MNKLLLFFFLASFSFIANAQKVTVYSADEKLALPGVAITTSNKINYISTNPKGEADLSRLNIKSNAVLIFQHNYYRQIQISYSDLKANNFIIEMQPTTIELSEFSITANKWEQNSNELPIEIEKVAAKDIEFNNPQTTADIMMNTGKVFVQKSQMGGGSPMIRGFAANGVLIMVDDVRMNNAIFRSGNLQNIINIDPNLIGHAEVIFGPGSVTYGSDALGGVMDFHTKKAEYAIDKKFDFNVELMGRASSANEEQTMSFGINLGGKKIASRTQFSYSKYGDLKAGKQHFGNYPDFGKRTHIVKQDEHGMDQMYLFPDHYIMSPSGYNSLFFNQKFSIKTGSRSNLAYQFIYSNTSDIPRYDRLIQWKNKHLKYAEWYYGPQLWMMHNLQFNSYRRTKIYDKIKAVVAYQQFGESRHDRKFQDSLFRHRDEKVHALSFNLDFEKNISKKIELFYGFELVYNNVISKAYGENIFTHQQQYVSSRYPSEYNHYLTSGLFTNLKYRFSEKLTGLIGFRYSRVFSDSKFDNAHNQLPYSQITMNMGAPNGSLGLAWLPTNKWQINFNVSSAFRAPNIDDAAKVFDSEPGNVVIPNNNLKPEFAYSTELGIERDFNDVAHLGINLFYTYVDNIIVRRDALFKGQDSIIYDGTLSKVQAMVNGQSAQIYGATASLRLKLSKDFNFETTYSITKGADDLGNNLRHIPPAFGSSRIHFKHGRYQAQFSSIYSGHIAFDKLAPSEQDKTHMYTPDGAEAWYTLNFKASIRISLITLNFGVDNILDRFYIPYSSGIPAAGRNFYVSFNLRY